ncbi:aspartic peptidase A1 [Pterulicium gracile]|uniref:Aspartic peptidase A1 n=1 Tax=Pterulicium gracile TaxID=1884261 RepID=A0A5C3QNV3_9AGAR|nr:aspartic peptidase A1 [Pterula gracilis]
MITLLGLAFLSLVAANPVIIDRSPVTLPVALKLNATGVKNIVERDVARAKALYAMGKGNRLQKRHDFHTKIENQMFYYLAEVGIGNPPTTYQLIVDTASSNTWIGNGRSYVITPTSRPTGSEVGVSYGSAQFIGNQVLDQLILAPGKVIANQSIGVATDSVGISASDGILGLGPVGLTLGTLFPAVDETIPTVVDNLFTQGTIDAHQVSVTFSPSNQISNVNGEITWGGINRDKIAGPVGFTPLTTASPSNAFWGFDQTIRYGTSTPILSQTAGIVDASTTLILISSDAFTRYRNATGAVLDFNTGLLRITPAQFANLQSMFFTINGVTYEFTANAQIWPRALNEVIGGLPSFIYLITASIGAPTGQGLDFVNGFVFVQRFYTVLDTAGQVGFAETRDTRSTVN